MYATILLIILTLASLTACAIGQPAPADNPAGAGAQLAAASPDTVVTPPAECGMRAPIYLLQMNDLDSLDLTDFPDLACKAGLSGHFTFSDGAGAALWMRNCQILLENAAHLSACSVDTIAEPA